MDLEHFKNNCEPIKKLALSIMTDIEKQIHRFLIKCKLFCNTYYLRNKSHVYNSFSIKK